MSSNNLKLWQAVEKTDPQFTKEYTGPGGFSGTAVNALYLTKRATEQFGRCGEGWGYDVLEERIDHGAPLLRKDGTEYGVNAQVHTLKLAFWFIGNDGQKKTVIHYGHTPFVTGTKFGPTTDFEASKKSLTDALGKCLSMLGFSADIRMGLYDDIHYVNELRSEADIERAEDKIDARAAKEAEYRDWLANTLNLIETAQTINELAALFKSAIRKLEVRKDEDGKLKVTRAKDARKAQLEAPAVEGGAQ